MTKGRQKYGDCSFITPDEYELQPEASMVTQYTGPDNFHYTEQSICITLANTAIKFTGSDLSENPEEMDPDLFPISINLFTQMAKHNADHLEYLRNNIEILRPFFNDFQADPCHEETIGDLKAALCQCSFLSNFRIYWLMIIWVADSMLVSATTMVPESGVQKGWKDIRRFVESVTF